MLLQKLSHERAKEHGKSTKGALIVPWDFNDFSCCHITEEKKGNMWNQAFSFQCTDSFKELKGPWESRLHPSSKSQVRTMLSVDVTRTMKKHSVEKTLKGVITLRVSAIYLLFTHQRNVPLPHSNQTAF